MAARLALSAFGIVSAEAAKGQAREVGYTHLVTLFCIGSYLFLYRETAVLFFYTPRGVPLFWIEANIFEKKIKIQKYFEISLFFCIHAGVLTFFVYTPEYQKFCIHTEMCIFLYMSRE